MAKRRNTAAVRRRPAADARAKILEAGLAVFADEGFVGTTTREIAGRAGVNLGLIKYYFGSKDALWRAVVDRVFEELGKELGDVAGEAGRGKEAVADLVRRAIRFMARNPAFVRLMNDECKRNSARMRWLVDRHGRGLYQTITTLFSVLKREGRAADIPDIHAYYMFVGAAGMLFSQAPECRRLVGKDPTKDARLIDAHAEAVVKLFLGGR